MLSVSNLTKTYLSQDSHPALQEFSFTLEEGDILTFLGESGSGKTTLLKLLAGLIDADSGEIDLRGNLITGPSKQLVAGYEEVKLVNQDFELGHKLKVWENLRYHILKYSKSAQEQRITELIQICRLEGLENKYSHELSGGQQQRVALGRALANEPQLLLLDEPFSNLNTNLKNRLRVDLERIIRESGTKAVFVMHDSSDALFISDKIGIIQHGELQQLDSSQEIYRNPKSVYVAQFFGNPNVLVFSEFIKLFPNTEFAHSNFKKVCIREADLKLLENNTHDCLALKVKRVSFMGGFYEVLTQHESEIFLRLHVNTNVEIQPGDTVFVQLDQENVIWLQE